MNFMERLEEGLSEDSTQKTAHMRVSTYRKSKQVDGADNPSESFLTEDYDAMAKSTVVTEVSTDVASPGTTQINTGEARLSGYS